MNKIALIVANDVYIYGFLFLIIVMKNVVIIKNINSGVT